MDCACLSEQPFDSEGGWHFLEINAEKSVKALSSSEKKIIWP